MPGTLTLRTKDRGSRFAPHIGSNAEHLPLRILLQNPFSPEALPSRGMCSTRWRDRRCSALKQIRLRRTLLGMYRYPVCVTQSPGLLETRRSTGLIASCLAMFLRIANKRKNHRIAYRQEPE